MNKLNTHQRLCAGSFSTTCTYAEWDNFHLLSDFAFYRKVVPDILYSQVYAFSDIGKFYW